MNQKITSRWLWSPDWQEEDRQQTRLVYFRCILDYQGGKLPLCIAADTRYKLYANGSLVQFGPAKGDDTVRYVDEVELSDALNIGKNVICVEVLRCSEDDWNSNHGLFPMPHPGLLVDGLEGDWRCHVNRAVSFPAEEDGFSPLHIHETGYPDEASLGWLDEDFDDSHWQTAIRSQEEPIWMPRPIPFMERTPGRLDLQETVIPPCSHWSIVLNGGEERCAFVRLALSGGAGAKIELFYSECYQIPEGNRFRKGNRTDSVQGVLTGYADRYTLSGQEKQIAPFWFRTFRYLRLTVETGEEPLTLHGLTYEETGYSLEVKTSVTTSDTTHEGIWDISLRTLRRCMHDTYIDCPFYEQLQYAMDTRSQILYTYAVSADDRLARKAIDDFSRAQRPDGLLNCSYPNKNVNVIPGFSIYYILMLHDHMMYFGDRALVQRYLPVAERILDYFDRHLTPEGLVDKIGGVNGKAPFWSFIDWAQEWLPTEGMPAAGLNGPITEESLLYVLGLQKAAELAEYIGQDVNAAAYRARAASVQSAIRTHCINPEGMIADGPGSSEVSQHGQVFGILTGTLTQEEGRRNLLATIQDKHYTQCTVAMCFYLFRAMEHTGLYEYTDQYWNIWRRMLDNECTTCVESEGYSRSECHAWGALALYELPSVTLGVRPAAPGYERMEVRPVPGYLTHADGTVHTPKGDVQVSWDREGDGIKLSVSCEDALRSIIEMKEM